MTAMLQYVTRDQQRNGHLLWFASTTGSPVMALRANFALVSSKIVSFRSVFLRLVVKRESTLLLVTARQPLSERPHFVKRTRGNTDHNLTTGNTGNYETTLAVFAG